MPELQVFLRPKKAQALDEMKSLERTSTDIVLRYYQVMLPIGGGNSSLQNYGQMTIDSYAKETQTFIEERRKVLTYLQSFKTHSQNLVPMKDSEIRMYKSLAGFLDKFEKSIDKHTHDKELSGD